MKLQTLSKIYLALVLTFLYVPIAVMILLSFNSSKFYRLPIDWTFKWYQLLFDNEKLLDASFNSILIAFITTVLATTVGTCAALAFFRHSFRGKNLLQLLLFPPIAIPWLIIGTSMLVFFFWIGIGRGFFALILGHVALAIPYVIIVVGARLKSFDKSLEESARSLGATSFQTFRYVTFPWLFPGFLAAALFVFAVSLDQFVISYFLATPDSRTLPVEIYTAIRKGFTPEINAISTIIILVSMSLLLIVSRSHKFSK
jgi:spermidine/putrescine transport system permease protein